AEQRLVVGQHADRAHRRAGRDHLDLVVEDLALGGEDLDAELRPGHATTPSMPPFMKKADSGNSSWSPSMTSRNERTVSSVETYCPGVPVNASATWNGCDWKRSTLRARCTVTLSSSESSSMPRIAMMSWSSL